MASKEDVYCTLVLTDSYVPGAAVLAHSLRDNGTSKQLAVLVTEDSVSPQAIDQLKSIYDYVVPVDRISSPNLANLAALGRLDLRHAFTKIALWQQTQFRKVVYIDADVVALRAPDELFELPAPFAAAPDIGWPDCFNSGLMLLSPSQSEYAALRSMAASGTSFDGADQGLLNEYYAHHPWHRLSFTYNCTPSGSYQYEPAYRHFKNDIKLVHFIGKEKPWTKGRRALQNEQSNVYKELLGRWWAVYDKHYTAVQQYPSQQHDQQVAFIRQFVSGEEGNSVFNWAASGLSAQAASTPMPAPAPASAPRPEPVKQEQEQQQQEKRVRFADEQDAAPARQPSPPRRLWDATKDAPPSVSEPEAHSFPSSHYSMSQSNELFHAPQEYPEAPKDMWYEVPESKPTLRAKPKPIFPWETRSPKPTRVFLEDESEYEEEPEEEAQPEPEPEPEPQPEFVPPLGHQVPGMIAAPVATRVFRDDNYTSPTTPTITVTHSDPWGAFSSKNAWDEDSSIDRYVQSLKQSAFRGSVQVLHESAPTTPRSDDSPPSQSARSTPTSRKAYKLADITTSHNDLPSMPVTPAVSYRQSHFWGKDEDSNTKTTQLQTARGVPEQNEWVCPNCGFSPRLQQVVWSRPLPPSIQSHAPTVPPGAFHIPPSSASTVPPGASHFVPSTVPAATRRPTSSSPLSSIASRIHTTDAGSPPTRTISPRNRSRPHETQAQAQANETFFTKNPLERLEELRRSSIATAQEPEKLPITSPTQIPTRQAIPSAAPLPQETGLGIRWQPPNVNTRQGGSAPVTGSDYTIGSAVMNQGLRQAEGEFSPTGQVPSRPGVALGGSLGGGGAPSAATMQAALADPDFGGATGKLGGQARRSSGNIMGEYDLA